MTALGQKLQIKQTAQLVLTPQLRQAIQLLQLTNLELSAFVAEEAERNPLITLVGETAEAAAVSAQPAARLEDQMRDATPDSAERALDAPRDAVFDEAVADGQAEWRRKSDRLAPMRDVPGDALGGVASAISLRDHLLAQIGCMRLSGPVRALAELMVDEIDDDGYLRSDDAEIAARHRAVPEDVAVARHTIQLCEPTGIGARDLADCLALQLAETGALDACMAKLLAHLDLVAANRIDRLTELLGQSRKTLGSMLALLRRLDPRPGLRLQHGDTRYIVPDVYIRRGHDGALRAELNEDSMPQLRIDRRYADRVTAQSGEARSFVSECRTNAAWLTRALDQRARTILRVATEILHRQASFFSDGLDGLRPMTLRDVAEELTLHESTVSRVTSGKYLSCERGTIELRFFFSTGLPASDGGEATSATVIRDRIRRMIAAENPSRPLSDDAIVSSLGAEGIEIARRTVAKYREGLKIPSSVRRRRKTGMSGD
ncbi:MAG: RNA polymerase factor sigma-54 [Pseudomonadota bacterium]